MGLRFQGNYAVPGKEAVEGTGSFNCSEGMKRMGRQREGL